MFLLCFVKLVGPLCSLLLLMEQLEQVIYINIIYTKLLRHLRNV